MAPDVTAPTVTALHMAAPDAAVPPVFQPPGRLTRRAEFLRVAAKGRKTPSSGVVMQALARDDQGPVRLGFTVTKKVGNAVIRNRTRRRLREAARAVLKAETVRGVDLVLIGRDSTRDRRFVLLVEDVRRAMVKLGAL